MEEVTLRSDRFYNVINLSRRSLSEAELCVLSRGLSFCPVPFTIDKLKLYRDLEAFFRRLRLSEFYANNEAESVTHHDDPLRCRSVWTPPVNRDKILDSYISVVRDEILSSDDRPFHNNLNKCGRTA